MDLIGIKKDQLVTHIAERDIDLLLLEEFSCNDDFVARIFQLAEKQNEKPSSIINIEARHSVSGLGKTKGETDLLLNFEIESLKYCYFFENKIDTDFQFNQFQRYLERSKEYTLTNPVDHIKVILIAPQNYHAQKNKDFKHIITYEEVIDYFHERLKTQNQETQKRYQHKINILKISIDKGRRGWEAVPCAEANHFYHSLAEYLKVHYPHFYIKIHQKEKIPKESKFVKIFDDRLINNSEVLRLKLRPNNKTKMQCLDLEIKDQCKHLEMIKDHFKENMPEGLRAKSAGKSLAFSYDIDNISTTKEFDDQLPAIETALKKANDIVDWYLEFRGDINKLLQSNNEPA